MRETTNGVTRLPAPDPVGACEVCARKVYQHAREGFTGRLGYYADEDGVMVCTDCVTPDDFPSGKVPYADA